LFGAVSLVGVVGGVWLGLGGGFWGVGGGGGGSSTLIKFFVGYI